MYSSVSNYRNVLTCNKAFGILIMGISLHLYSCGFMNGRLIICCKQPKGFCMWCAPKYLGMAAILVRHMSQNF